MLKKYYIIVRDLIVVEMTNLNIYNFEIEFLIKLNYLPENSLLFWNTVNTALFGVE